MTSETAATSSSIDNVQQILRLGVISRVCHILQDALGEDDCYDVAELLVKTIEKDRAIGSSGVDAFVREIKTMDDEFPTELLQKIHSTAVPPLSEIRALMRREATEFGVMPPENALSQRCQLLALNVARQELDVLDASMPVSEEERYQQMQFKRLGLTGQEQPQPQQHPQKRDFDADMVETDVKVRQDPPHFLRREAALRAMASSVRASHVVSVVKDPNGSLVTSIEKQQQRLKDRKELKEVNKRDGTYQEPISLNERDIFRVNSTQGYRNKDKKIEDQRRMLKIYDKKEEFLQMVRDNKVLVVIGETGSGKTTQMTQYLAEAGFASGGKIIGCTQPRRLPARSVAERVAIEYGTKVGQEVGYTVRFDDMTSSRTKIKYMTDGILMREALADPAFSRYSVLIIDEAHERNINTDVLLGLLKHAITKNLRDDFRLVVTSATLNVEKFSRFFNGATIFSIPGRSYPVDVIHLSEPGEDYIYDTVTRVVDLHLNEPEGDVLIFMPGKEEIEETGDRIKRWEAGLPAEVPRVQVHMIYATMPSEVQARVFLPAPPNTRKVIIATNIAETSVTIDGIKYVIDPGVFKQNVFNPKAGIEVLKLSPISQAQANQRKGRAGRTSPGKCYRLYTQEAFENEMLVEPVPEIQRSNLSNVVLTMKATGVVDILGFDFIDPPPRDILVDALNKLYALGALDDEGLLTQQGRRMAEYPIDPTLSTVLLAASTLGCAEEVLTVVAVLTSEDLFYRPKDKAERADARRQRLQQRDGDHMTMLHVYNSWAETNFDRKWCEENFIHPRALHYAKDVRGELGKTMLRQGLEVASADPKRRSIAVRQAFTAGFFMNVARRAPDGVYKTLSDGQQVFLHPSCAVFHRPPPWVMYHTVVMTTKEYMREVTPIDMRWLVTMAPKYFQYVGREDLDEKHHRDKIEPLFNKFVGPNEWRWTPHMKRAKYR